jgi:hypothetical protein
MLHANAFFMLGITTRDDRLKIVEKAEERALHLDHDICQKARSDLTNPRARLTAELGWMPGVAPRIAEKLTKTLLEDPISVRSEGGLPELARANLMAAALELVNEDEDVESISEFVLEFSWVVESIDVSEVLRDINEDRAIAGFPEISGVEVVEEGLVERRKTYRSILKSLLDMMDSNKLVEIMTNIVSVATEDGEDQGPILIDELVDAYEVESQGFLQKESENITKLVERVISIAPQGEKAIAPILNKLEHVAKNWDRVAQPIQISSKSRGIKHQQSHDIAYELRSLGIDLYNKHDMLERAYKINELLRELFVELPEVVEKLDEDAEMIDKFRHQANEQKEINDQWIRDVTFSAEVGLAFKDYLSISPEGIRWKGRGYPLDSITRLRWGAVRHSVNGISTGTDYTIGFGDNHIEQVINLKKESTYSGFLEALWRAVCIRLMLSILEQLKDGRNMTFGDMMVEDGAVTLVKHKLLGINERERLGWHDVHVWSSAGTFHIGKLDDKKVYGSASYISHWNTHLIEHLIREGFKKGVHKLSDYLKD